MRFFVIRRGWNAANQPSIGRRRSPKDTFESGLDSLVAIVEAESSCAAVASHDATVYNNQHLFAVANPRAIRGLTREIREYSE